MEGIGTKELKMTYADKDSCAVSIGWLRDDECFELLATFNNSAEQLPQIDFFRMWSAVLSTIQIAHTDAIALARYDALDVVDLV